MLTKSINETDLTVDFEKAKIIYPEDKDFKINDRQICDFSQNENFVVFECVHRLLDKGYKPAHLELEPRWQVGHGASGGRADILVKNQENNPLLLIECKTAGSEFEKAWGKTKQDGDQLFSYVQQIAETQYLCLYACDLINGEISLSQKIISHKDNEKILDHDKTLASFFKATNVKERFAVWRDIYQLEYTESGIFEGNIQPYQIGKNKYTLADDTKAVDATDKKGKYHQFRTILRKHNIARRENAFEVLVNLFLCKIVDEGDNTTDLQFYWKGIAYDNYFDFVDRLQDLYQKGMRKFLNEEISYISNEQIDNAFWAVKKDRNATKKQIQAYFRELKFFTNSAFSFVDTHNEELFNKNAKVLLEIVQMWQGLRLKTEQQNQFLGDMFEYFLDNSIKQSNGQFFTPLPICKFIVASLPLAEKIKTTLEPLQAIDYACGSGHFLNEYALQIKPLVAAQKRDLRDYYSQITGIEKEDRLAKVAKVAAYMYGQEQIKILDADALANHPQIPLASFDVLVANPPFAVEGFLQTLNDSDKKHYRLIEATGKTSNTNTIQCFFLERIHHLMAPGGVVGVIVPSSILSNSDAVHIRTRELLLQFFDLVSIAELGSGTFGKTGTNTVVLFLRRKIKRPEPAEHYHNRVKDFFEGDDQAAVYQDLHLIKAYCDHIEAPYDEYKKLFAQTNIEPFADLLQCDIFKDYQQDFEQSSKIKSLKKSNVFKKKTKAEQQAELDRRFIAYLHEIEQDKLYHFILAHEQTGKVLIVNAPSTNKEQKQFLGYKWSDAKRGEGIQYNGGETVNDIITCLFDPKNLDNSDKINTAIKNNFMGEITDPPLRCCRYAKLTDMLDFGRKDFNKAISLNPKTNIDIETNRKLVKLGEVIVEGKKSKIKVGEAKEVENGAYPFFTSGEKVLTYNSFLVNGENLYLSTGGNAIVKYHNGKAAYSADTYCLTTKANTKCYYLNLVLNSIIETINDNYFKGVGLKHLQKQDLKQIKIPLPPLKVQQQIVNKCETVDKQAEKARQTIAAAKQRIETIMQNVPKPKTLGDAVQNITDVINPEKQSGSVNFIGLENIEQSSGRLVGSIETDFATVKSNKNVFQKGDILYGKLRPNLNKVYLAQHNGICSTDILVFRLQNPNNAIFCKHYFLSSEFNSAVLKTVSGQQLPRTSWTKIIKIPAPPLDIQRRLSDRSSKVRCDHRQISGSK